MYGCSRWAHLPIYCLIGDGSADDRQTCVENRERDREHKSQEKSLCVHLSCLVAINQQNIVYICRMMIDRRTCQFCVCITYGRMRWSPVCDMPHRTTNRLRWFKSQSIQSSFTSQCVSNNFMWCLRCSSYWPDASNGEWQRETEKKVQPKVEDKCCEQQAANTIKLQIDIFGKKQ